MKKDEVKLRLTKNVGSLIDTYFGESTFMDKMINSTLKALITLNISKIDGFLGMFADETGDIDVEKVISTYADQFDGEGIPLDIRDFIKDPFIVGLMPGKKLILKKQDILNLVC